MRTAALLIALAGPVQAESLCGWTDEAAVIAALQGDWVYRMAGAYVTASAEEVGESDGDAVMAADGTLEVDGITWVLAPSLTLRLKGPVYDVDQVDDILDTVEAPWMADAVSMTPCGPSDLPQLTATYDLGGAEALLDQMTLLPYFSDKVILVLEGEWEGDWGMAFITVAALMVRP